MNSDYYTVLAIITAIIIFGASYYLPRQLKKPRIGAFGFLPQGGYSISGVDLKPGSKPFKGAHGFPTIHNPMFRNGEKGHAGIFEFDMTNDSPVTLKILSIGIEVTRYAKGTIHVGNGEVVGGGNVMKYQITLEGREGIQACRAVSSDYEYIKIQPNDLEAFEIHVTSAASGLFEVRPVVEYSILGKRSRIILEHSDFPLVFFDNSIPNQDEFGQTAASVR